MATKAEPYGLDPRFEAAAVLLACSSSRFYARIAHQLDPDLLGVEANKLALRAAHAIAAEAGTGPSATATVAQRLRRWVSQGSLTLEKMGEVMDALDAAEDAGGIGVEEAVAELAPILRRRLERQAVEEATLAYGKKATFATVVKLIEKAGAVGVQKLVGGVRLGAGAFAEIERVAMLDRLPTGIPELDVYLDGGWARQELFEVAGETGHGKSMFMGHAFSSSTVAGLHCCYATLEISRARILARSVANITGVETKRLLGRDEDAWAEATRALEGMNLGAGWVEDFTPGATKVEHILDWVRSKEDEVGRRVDLVVVDSGEKLSADGRDLKHHEVESIVYEQVRLKLAHERDAWAMVGSQVKNKNSRDKKRKRIDTDDLSGSTDKSRHTDILVTLNANDAITEVELFVAKNRNGASRGVVGPLLVEYAKGRMCAVSRSAGVQSEIPF